MFDTRILVTLLICLSLIACKTTKPGIHACSIKEWKHTQYSNNSLKNTNLRKKDVDNIRALIALYRATNYQSQFNTLNFQSVLWDNTKQHRVYFFEIQDSGDVQAIFRLDKNDNLVDNFLVYSKDQPYNASMLKPWKHKKGFYNTFSKESPELEKTEIVDSLKKLYRLNSKDPYFDELTFDKVLTTEKSRTKAYVFDIQSVRHTQIVFELDQHDNLIDNYATSLWKR